MRRQKSYSCSLQKPRDIKSLAISLGKAEGTHAEQYIMEELDALHGKGEVLRKRIVALTADMQRNNLTEMEFDRICQLLSAIGDTIKEYSMEQKRAAVRTFVRKIVWDGENAHVYLFHSDVDDAFSDVFGGERG